MKKSSLPIDLEIPRILDLVENHRRLVLTAPPGSGKTTRVAPAILREDLLDPEHPSLILLQPRRIAARSVAARMAWESGEELGRGIGYQVRFEKRISRETRLHVLTEGVLTRRLLADPFLEGVGAVVLDEFHERSIHSDLALAMLKDVRDTVRNDLIVIVMSATLDAAPIAEFLGGCPIVHVQAPCHPVEIVYRPSAGDTVSERTARAVIDEGMKTSGHILVFLPGMEEIRRTSKLIESSCQARGDLVLPLHGSLRAEDQDEALRPSEQRKIILSTNVAETSLTIDGVAIVIDTGLARFASHDASKGLDRLALGRISRASAIQRAGRAGRTGPGRCVRLWPERENRGMAESDVPEVLRVDLAPTLLYLHAWGARDPAGFGWFESPPRDSLESGESLLRLLDAVTSDGALTDVGRRLLEYPAHPRLARLLDVSAHFGIFEKGATAAAILSEKDILLREGRRADTRRRGGSDLFERMELLERAERERFHPRVRQLGVDPAAARAVCRARDAYLRGSRRTEPTGSTIDEDESLLKAVLTAFPDRVARRRGSGSLSGTMVGGRGVRLEPESVVRDADLFLAIDPREDDRSRISEARVSIASEIKQEWLEEFSRQSLRTESIAEFDRASGKVIGVSRMLYRDLMIQEKRGVAVSAETASEVLASQITDNVETLIRTDENAAGLLDRIEFLRERIPEASLPEFDDEFRSRVSRDACFGKRSLEEVKRSPWAQLIRGELSHAQARFVDTEAPERIQVPSGNQVRLTYERGRAPVLSVRLQELFGMRETPKVAGGRVSVLLHLLGPNYRPVQVTDDLESFWKSTYFQVRKDLKNRYPRHSWPEDPMTAKPEAKGGARRS